MRKGTPIILFSIVLLFILGCSEDAGIAPETPIEDSKPACEVYKYCDGDWVIEKDSCTGKTITKTKCPGACWKGGCKPIKQEVAETATTSEEPVKETIKAHCCLDNSLKIGSYKTSRAKDEAPCEDQQALDQAGCKRLTESKGYRYAPWYMSTDEFALVCTEGVKNVKAGDFISCSLDDTEFFDAAFEGHILAIDALKEATGGVLPKEKMEFHIAQDRDCWPTGYGEQPTGGSTAIEGHPVLCNPQYNYYLKSGKTLDYRKLQSQVLVVHEPIHNIFGDYFAGSLGVPYKMTESFSKAVSLVGIGLMEEYDGGYLHGGYLDPSLGQTYSIDNPPPEGSVQINNFFVYSLHERFGFDKEDMKEFFRRYKEMEGVSDNLRVKTILDDILGTDTMASFKDVGLNPAPDNVRAYGDKEKSVSN